MTLTDIERVTAEVHFLLRERAAELEPAPGVNPETLRGLCATGATLLQRRLAALGVEAELVAARSVFGNVFHYWVFAEGIHADPTYLQFDAATPWRVSTEAPRLIFGDWVDRPTTWAVEPAITTPWPEAQSPARVLGELGL